jgi:hypothetical protein
VSVPKGTFAASAALGLWLVGVPLWRGRLLVDDVELVAELGD